MATGELNQDRTKSVTTGLADKAGLAVGAGLAVEAGLAVDAGLVVEARGLTKWFGAATALDQVDLVMSSGCVHGLVGPNGAGKTTLLSVLFGLVHPDEGTARLFGRTRAEAGAAWLDGVGGFVETPRFYPYLSGRRNLSVLAGLDRHDDRSRGDDDSDSNSGELIEEMLEVVGLAGAGDQKVRGYSLGMRQRLGLAAALIRRPRLLILDEPGNGMDPAGIRDLKRSLRQLADDGVAVLLSSHDMAQVSDVCDSVTVLNQGRVAFSGSLAQMRAAAPEPTWRLSTSDDDAALIEAGCAVKEAGGTHAAVVEVGGLHASMVGVGGLHASMVEAGGTQASGVGAGGTQASGVGASGLHAAVVGGGGGGGGGGLRIVADQGRLDDYVIRLGRAGIAVRALTQDATPLEALFFHLTEDPAAGEVTS